MNETRETTQHDKMVFGTWAIEIAGCPPVSVWNLSVTVEHYHYEIFRHGMSEGRVQSKRPSNIEITFQVGSENLYADHLWFVQFMSDNNIQFSLKICNPAEKVFSTGRLTLLGIDTNGPSRMTYSFQYTTLLEYGEEIALPVKRPSTKPKFTMDGRLISHTPDTVVPPKPKRKVSFD